MYLEIPAGVRGAHFGNDHPLDEFTVPSWCRLLPCYEGNGRMLKQEERCDVRKGGYVCG